MTMTPGIRKFALLLHVAFSLGWMGSVLAYLALAANGLLGRDAALARSAYLSMELIGWTVIVPFSLATLLSGLLQSLGTEWGLFRHYWVTVKFVLAAAGSLILLTHMKVVGQMADSARAATFSDEAFGGIRVQLVVHAAGGLLVLLAATALSFYKPWGMTPYGRRIQQAHSAPVLAIDKSSTAPSRLGIYYLLGIMGTVLALLLLHHLAGGGLRHH